MFLCTLSALLNICLSFNRFDLFFKMIVYLWWGGAGKKDTNRSDLTQQQKKSFHTTENNSKKSSLLAKKCCLIQYKLSLKRLHYQEGIYKPQKVFLHQIMIISFVSFLNQISFNRACYSSISFVWESTQTPEWNEQFGFYI